jgi:hypothetical protein
MKHYLLVFFAELMILIYYLFRSVYNERNQLQQHGFQQITKNEFKALTKSLGFNRFGAWFSPATRDHYTGTYQEFSACIFSFQTNGPAYLAVIFYSDKWQLPILKVEPRSFSDQLKYMFGGNPEKHLIKQTISEGYNVVYESSASSLSLTPEIIAKINESDSIELELTHKALFLYDHKKFTDEPENYERAIQQGCLYASMFADSTLSSREIRNEKVQQAATAVSADAPPLVP